MDRATPGHQPHRGDPRDYIDVFRWAGTPWDASVVAAMFAIGVLVNVATSWEQQQAASAAPRPVGPTPGTEPAP